MSKTEIRKQKYFCNVGKWPLLCIDNEDPDRQGIRLVWLGYASRKHAYIILTPLNPTLYSKTGVYRGIHFFLFLLKIIDCGYSLKPPHRGGSYEYPQSIFWAEIWKISVFYLKSFSFWR